MSVGAWSEIHSPLWMPVAVNAPSVPSVSAIFQQSLAVLAPSRASTYMPFDDERTLLSALLSGDAEAEKLIAAIAAAGAGRASEWDQQTLAYSPRIAVAAGLYNRFSAGSHFIVHSVAAGNFDDYALEDANKLAAFKARIDDARAAHGTAQGTHPDRA